MLPKKYRLPLRTELHRAQREGTTYQFPFFGLLVAKNKLSLSRFAFIVSNKIHKKATKRNRIKRLLGESVRSLLAKTNPGFEVVFLAKKKIVGQNLKTTRSAIVKSFKEIGLI